ncbi:hypothetical protein HanIR_Chr06g0276521 [Helianthus annuus]|nr:hypothetical protein HanIR_Chr06g0276521 [Helianthus annuus]
MHLPNLIPPVPPPDRNHRQLRQNNSPPNRRRHFLRTLHPQTHMPVPIPHNNKRLEPGSLSSPGLFLNRHDFHHLIFQRWKDLVNDLVFFHGERMKIDFFQFGDFAVFYETAELGDGDPFFFFSVASAGATAATAAVATTTASAAEASAESAAFSASLSHDFGLQKVEDSEMRVNGCETLMWGVVVYMLVREARVWLSGFIWVGLLSWPS